MRELSQRRCTTDTLTMAELAVHHSTICVDRAECSFACGPLGENRGIGKCNSRKARRFTAIGTRLAKLCQRGRDRSSIWRSSSTFVSARARISLRATGEVAVVGENRDEFPDLLRTETRESEFANFVATKFASTVSEVRVCSNFPLRKERHEKCGSLTETHQTLGI